MAAPNSTLAAKIRAGTVARHIFLRLDHSQGELFLWDGIGTFPYGGNTYRGVGGLAQIGGVSDSLDVQNHEVICTLNGVALPDLIETDTSIEDRAAEIAALWIEEDGTVAASETVFVGTGDVLRLKMDAEAKQLTAKLKAPLAEWRAPPLAFYTDADQQRRYPGDTGFSLVKSLEGATVAGWSVNEEASGGIPISLTFYLYTDSVQGFPIGDNTYGLTVQTSSVSGALVVHSYDSTSNRYVEETTGAATDRGASSPFALRVGGVNTYLDLAGDVRSAGGLRVLRSASTARRLRRQSLITSNGAATATTISTVATPTANSQTAATRLIKTGSGYTSVANLDQTPLVYNNRNGERVAVNGSNLPVAQSGGAVFIEETTGAACSVSGGLLKVGGSNCVVSANGVILSPGGRRIVKTGGTAADFLRVWA